MFKKILVPIDGSETSGKAFQIAIGAAAQGKGKLVVLHVMEPSPYEGLTEYNKTARDEAVKVLDAAAASCQDRGVASETVLVEAVHVDEGILSAAAEHDCDVIIMGTHGRRGLNRLLMGSVATNVLASATMPVLIVPARS